MLQLKNESPYAPAIIVFPDKAGIDTLYVVVRATFALAPEPTPLGAQPPPAFADEYWGEPDASSLKFCSELHIGKPTTDVVLVGSARTPGGRAVPEMHVSMQVAERQKVAAAIGPRTWKSGGSFTPPEPFTTMPLTWERAFGGFHRFGPDPLDIAVEDRNPVGVAFRGKRSASEVVGQPLPNVEDARQRIASFGDDPDPVGFGFVAPSWSSRRRFAGTYDEAWQRTRAPYLPHDFDARFFNAAPPDMVFDRYLEGGEPVRLSGIHPSGPVELALPRVPLSVAVRIAGATERPPVHLETVLFEPDEDRFSLTFRAQLRCDKQVLKVETVTIQPTSDHGGAGP